MLIDALFQEVQTVEDEAWNLMAQRSIDTALGNQLDLLGTIIGAVRLPGQSDADYRIRLRAQIIQNLSCGEPETLISILTLLIGGGVSVYVDELGGGNVLPFVSTALTSTQVNQFVNLCQRSAPIGVRVLGIGLFYPGDTFALAGPDVSGLGFGSTTDAAAGGRLAWVQAGYGLPYAMDGNDIDADGFGTISDAFIGGLLVGL